MPFLRLQQMTIAAQSGAVICAARDVNHNRRTGNALPVLYLNDAWETDHRYNARQPHARMLFPSTRTTTKIPLETKTK